MATIFRLIIRSLKRFVGVIKVRKGMRVFCLRTPKTEPKVYQKLILMVLEFF